MGYNRGGRRRTARLKRRKRLEQRLASRPTPEASAPQAAGLGEKVKKLAKTAVEKVEGVLHAAAEKVKHAVKKEDKG